jgi:hypothetical protein
LYNCGEGQRNKIEKHKIMVDKIRTLLGGISMRLMQNKNWNHLEGLIFLLNINEDGWW